MLLIISEPDQAGTETEIPDEVELVTDDGRQDQTNE